MLILGKSNGRVKCLSYAASMKCSGQRHLKSQLRKTAPGQSNTLTAIVRFPSPSFSSCWLLCSRFGCRSQQMPGIDSPFSQRNLTAQRRTRHHDHSIGSPLAARRGRGATRDRWPRDTDWQARKQTGALGAIAPSAGSIAPSGASLCTLCA